MIDGLGITGYEGMFSRVCEITLSVLRTHRETLINVLETFIHDPLVEWTKSYKSSGEVQNPHAQVPMRMQHWVIFFFKNLISYKFSSHANWAISCSEL